MKKVEPKVQVDNTTTELEDDDSSTSDEGEAEVADHPPLVPRSNSSSTLLTALKFVASKYSRGTWVGKPLTTKVHLPSPITQLQCDHLNQLWFGCGDGTVGCWNVGDERQTLSVKAHTRGISAMAATKSHVWAFSDDKKLSVFTQLSRSQLKTVDIPYRTLCACGDGESVFIGTSTSFVVTYTWEKNEVVPVGHWKTPHNRGILVILVKKHLYWLAEEGGYLTIARPSATEPNQLEILASVKAHSDRIADIVALDDQIIISGSKAGDIKEWQFDGHSRLHNVWTLDNAHKGGVHCLAVGCDYNVIYSAGFDKVIRAWSVLRSGPPQNKRIPLFTLERYHADSVNCLVASEANSTDCLLSSSWDDRSLVKWIRSLR